MNTINSKNCRRTVSSIKAAVVIIIMTLTACVNFDNATTATTVKIKVEKPADFTTDIDMSGKTVTMTVNSQTIATTTDKEGIAVFNNITPDVYDISTSWTITGAEYEAATNTEEVVTSATVSGSLNSKLIDGSEILTLTTNASPDRDIVIGKVYYASSKDNNNRNYLAGKYIELYNQSNRSIDVSGLYVAMTEAESTPAYTLENLNTTFGTGKNILLKQIYRIPAGTPYIIEPGGTVVICNSATDHTTNASLENNLLDADFEVKDVTGKYVNNPNTPAMEMIYQIYSGTSVMSLLQGGPCGVVIFRTNDDVTAWQKVYKYGKTSGNQWVVCPADIILDGMEALANKTSGIDVSTKRLYDNIDAGYTYVSAATGWTGETVYRKTSKTAPEGHKILVDTNNSSNDFQISTTIKPREYDN